MKNPTLIAEIGCNHKGDINIAKEFVNVAKDFCKVTAVKFQKRNIQELLTSEEYNAPHPIPYHSYGETYGKHREFLEFSLEQHRELKNYCDERGVNYGCSVWDMTSLKEIVSLAPAFMKIPSAANTNFKLLEYLCKNYSGLIHLSLGMTTRYEERNIVSFFDEHRRIKDLVLYACTSGYPVPPEDVCLLEIKRLSDSYGHMVHAIGFSGHHNGISFDIAAYTMGAEYIERHFTLDRTWKGTDHAASLEPDGLRRLNRDLNSVKKALNYKDKEILDIEISQRRKLKWDRQANQISETTVVPEEQGKKDFRKIKLLLMDVDGVLTDSGMYYTERGDELKKFNTRDGAAVAMLKKAEVKTGIITREDTEVVLRRAKKINVDFLYQGVTDKLAVVKEIVEKLGITPDDVCYIGDDIYDLDAIRYVGLSAVPRDAMSECKSAADYICHLKGGEGCVLEVAELILDNRYSSVLSQEVCYINE